MKQLILIPLLLINSAVFSQQVIYAIAATDSNDLYSFDLSNCTRTLIGPTGQTFWDIAFTSDGRLWGLAGGQLYQIDTATAQCTLVGYPGIFPNNLVGLNDSILLTESSAMLYGINVNNLSNYLIDTIKYFAHGDLTWYDEDLYMVTPLVRIRLNSTYTEILSVDTISNSVPLCLGAVTASFTGNYNAIIGFSGPDLIKICPFDGSYQMLCPGLNIPGTPGAAALRLPIQQPPPTTCQMINSSDNSKVLNYKLDVSPNPFSTQLTFSLADNVQTTVSIYDFLGQQILQQSFTNSTTINTERLADDIYFYELRNSIGLLKTGKVVKQ